MRAGVVSIYVLIQPCFLHWMFVCMHQTSTDHNVQNIAIYLRLTKAVILGLLERALAMRGSYVNKWSSTSSCKDLMIISEHHIFQNFTSCHLSSSVKWQLKQMSIIITIIIICVLKLMNPE
jgi:hypothetical protein